MRPVQRTVLSVGAALALAAGGTAIVAQASASDGGNAFGAGATVSYQPETGAVGFVGSALGKPIKLGAKPGASAASVAKGYLTARADKFGLDASGNALAVERQEATQNGTSVRLSQTYRGVPVLGGEYVVNLDDDNNLLSVLGESSPVTDLGVTPAISAKAAAAVARGVAAKDAGLKPSAFTVATPALRVYDGRILGIANPTGRPTLAWYAEARGALSGKVVIVDATTGKVSLSWELYAAAKNRSVCDANNADAQLPCTAPVWTEGNTPAARTPTSRRPTTSRATPTTSSPAASVATASTARGCR